MPCRLTCRDQASDILYQSAAAVPAAAGASSDSNAPVANDDNRPVVRNIHGIINLFDGDRTKAPKTCIFTNKHQRIFALYNNSFFFPLHTDNEGRGFAPCKCFIQVPAIELTKIYWTLVFRKVFFKFSYFGFFVTPT